MIIALNDDLIISLKVTDHEIEMNFKLGRISTELNMDSNIVEIQPNVCEMSREILFLLK